MSCLTSFSEPCLEDEIIFYHTDLAESRQTQALTVYFFISSESRVCIDLMECLWLAVNCVSSKKSSAGNRLLGEWALKCCFLVIETKTQPVGALLTSSPFLPSLSEDQEADLGWGAHCDHPSLTVPSPHLPSLHQAHLLHRERTEVNFMNLPGLQPMVLSRGCAPPSSTVEVLTLRTSEGNCVWRYGL